MAEPSAEFNQPSPIKQESYSPRQQTQWAVNMHLYPGIGLATKKEFMRSITMQDWVQQRRL